MATRNTGILSKNFHIQELGENVFAAVHRSGGLAISNAGLVNLGERLLCFDTFLSPLAAIDLNLIAESMFDRPVDCLVFSHYHSDHTWGSQAFPMDVEIIASSQTRALIETAGQDEIRSYRDNSENMHALLQALRTQPQGKLEEQSSSLWAEFIRATLESLVRARVRPPTLTFSEQMNLFGSRERVHLFQLCGGHTTHDTLMYLPSHGVLFTGDLVTVQCHPYIAESTPGGLASALDEILKMSPLLVVPGHGPVGTLDDVRLLVNYMQELERIAARIRASGKNLDLAMPAEVPEKFGRWGFENYFQDNLRFMIRSLG